MFKNFRIELKWAFIFIAMTLLWMVLEKLCGLHSTYIDYHLYLTNLFAIPAILVYVFALRDKKKSFYEGQMNFLKGFISGVVITVIIALFSPLTQWVISYIITPEYFPNVIKRSVEIGYFPTIEEAEAQFNYRNYAIQSIISALVMGLLTSIIVMLFLRTKDSK